MIERPLGVRAINTLVLVAALSGCGPELVEPSPLRCEAGPALTIEREPMAIVVEGSGGPTAAEWLTLTSADGSPAVSLHPAGDGGMFVNWANQAIARLDPALAPMWTRALVHAGEPVDSSHAVSESGLDVITVLLDDANVRTSWHTHIDNDGNCEDAEQLLLMGDAHAVITSHVRVGSQLAFAGLFRDGHGYYTRGAVALSSRGSVSGAVELDGGSGYVSRIELYTDGGARLLAAYETHEPQGSWGYALASVWLDEALSVIAGEPRGFHHLGYRYDAQRRLYSLWRDGSAYDVPPTPTPTSITLMRLSSPTQPAGELIERAIPADCEYGGLYMHHDDSQVLQCRNEPRVRGYAGPGADPVWVVTIEQADFEIGQLSFDTSGRLWLLGRVDDQQRIGLLSW